MGVGVMFAAASCFMALLPHLLYGPGQEAIDLAEASSSAATTLLANVSSVASQKSSVSWCVFFIDEESVFFDKCFIVFLCMPATFL